MRNLLADLTTRAKLAEFFGRDPHPTGDAKGIYHLGAARFPQYRFEWHPQRRNVYVVRIGSKPEVAEVMAFNIETHGDAHNAVLIWLRGYAEGQTPNIVKPHLVKAG